VNYHLLCYCGLQLKKVVKDLVVNGDEKSFPKSKILAALATVSGEPKVCSESFLRQIYVKVILGSSC
jgi:hypothetical protein